MKVRYLAHFLFPIEGYEDSSLYVLTDRQHNNTGIVMLKISKDKSTFITEIDLNCLQKAGDFLSPKEFDKISLNWRIPEYIYYDNPLQP